MASMNSTKWPFSLKKKAVDGSGLGYIHPVSASALVFTGFGGPSYVVLEVLPAGSECFLILLRNKIRISSFNLRGSVNATRHKGLVWRWKATRGPGRPTSPD